MVLGDIISISSTDYSYGAYRVLKSFDPSKIKKDLAKVYKMKPSELDNMSRETKLQTSLISAANTFLIVLVSQSRSSMYIWVSLLICCSKDTLKS